MTDADYIYAFQLIVMPIALEFAPELVISMFGKKFLLGTFTTHFFGQFRLVLMQRMAMIWANAMCHPLGTRT